MADIPRFIREQLAVWPLAAGNFASLAASSRRSLEVGGLEVQVQFNPCRIASSTAKIDKATLDARPCFLCIEHRQPEQFHIPFTAGSGNEYRIQVNPFPIFPDHLVIARDAHEPQSIRGRQRDMLELARALGDFTIYYNGPFSGASAPDHFHFQACPRRLLPLENAVEAWLQGIAAPSAKTPAAETPSTKAPAPETPSAKALALDPPSDTILRFKGASIYHFSSYTRGIYCLSGEDPEAVSSLFDAFLAAAADHASGEAEPRFNLYSWTHGAEYRLLVVMRTEIRSRHFFTDGPDHLTISPGAAEMAGIFVAPILEDYEKVTALQLEEMLSDVSISASAELAIESRLQRRQDTLEVGIMAAPEISFEFIGDGAGLRRATIENGRISYCGSLHDELFFPASASPAPFSDASFILYGVTIGIDFHWQQRRDLRYSGSLKLIPDGDRIVAVNIIGIEDYLLSVISSEMKSSASLELLKAHAVISRSWCMARIEERRNGSPKAAHALFDVCADDHCQRYQGRGMAAGETVQRAIDETWGMTLRYGGELCDARYSKCCGGATELYSSCWEDIDPPYLQSFPDTPASAGAIGIEAPSAGVHGRGPESPSAGALEDGRAFCDCEDAAVLGQVLNDYDLKTRDFYRWEQRYTVSELSELLKRRTGTDFGEVRSLEAVERGPSGRIKTLRIAGSLRTATIGKELAIRRALSESHLKSSAFEVSLEDGTFILRGRGWGHGVGLCQIGAAVMADKGYDFRQILKHYYRGATIE